MMPARRTLLGPRLADRVLIAYSTVDGHTRAICERIALVLEGEGHKVRIDSLDDGDPPLDACDRFVLGASIRYGRHRPNVTRFVNRHADALATRRGALFSVNLVARKPEKQSPDTNPYMRKLLHALPWQPEVVGVFAGRLDYPRYGKLDRAVIRLIMKITGGPADGRGVYEFTDWTAVEDFARRVSRA
jgi:menaquinone-dependent protoporphyrinogen oxidase